MKHNWNQYKIWKYKYAHSFLCPNIKYDNCDLMPLHMTITALLQLWHWRKCKRKTTLALAFVQLCTSWTATPEYEVQTRNPWIWFLALASTKESAPTHRIYLYAYKTHKCYFSFSIQNISFILEYESISMSLKKSWISKRVLVVVGNSQNAIGITFTLR